MITSTLDVSSMSTIKAKVELYDGSTLVKTCTCSDVLESFRIYREGDLSKFFGFGVCQKIALNLIDLDRELSLSTNNTVKVWLGDGETFDCPYPIFYITEVERDEDSNTISLTGFDIIHKASENSFSELGLVAPYTLYDIASACAIKLGMNLKIDSSLRYTFALSYDEGANLEGTELLRDILNAIAEVTQTIYFINNNNELVFIRLDGEVKLTVTRANYYALTTQTDRTLVAICNATELGDNITATTGAEGVTQYIRNNPFWELRTDLATLLEEAVLDIGGLTICQFDMDWDGNYLLEIGDKIALTTEDGNTVDTFILSDTIMYDGVYNELSEWKFTENETESPSNPSSIGDKINQTFARVDKVNKEILLVSGTASDNTARISQLEVKDAEIVASVQSIETKIEENSDVMDTRIETLTKEVALKVDSDAVEILVEKTLETGVEKVVTAAKKYTFDDTGLNVSSAGSNISTTITEDGMRIYRNSSEVLIADNQGVKAEDLHATTFLIIGTTSRLEDRQNRTACFWIGD